MTNQLIFGSQSTINLTLLMRSVTHGDFFEEFSSLSIYKLLTQSKCCDQNMNKCNVEYLGRLCLHVNAFGSCLGFLLFSQSSLVVFKIINCDENAPFSVSLF